MKKLEISQMENLQGSDSLCAFALGFALITVVASGGWSLIGASMLCATKAY